MKNGIVILLYIFESLILDNLLQSTEHLQSLSKYGYKVVAQIASMVSCNETSLEQVAAQFYYIQSREIQTKRFDELLCIFYICTSEI